MKLLSGSEVVEFIKERQAKQVRNLRQSWGVVPRFAILQTVDSPVIDTYVRLKKRYAEDILVDCDHYKLDQSQLEDKIIQLNADKAVQGIIVQLPLADSSETDRLLGLIAPEKDVDGLGLAPDFDPATPVAINWLLAAYNIDPAKNSIAIVGNGRLVGAPLAKIWRESGVEPVVFDENSDNMAAELKGFDIVVSATGVSGLLRSEMIKPGAAVVDAGTSVEDGVIVGDAHPELYQRDDLKITPQKGGVGPLTIAALLDNVILAARRVAEKSQD